jgi:hypothetical protein
VPTSGLATALPLISGLRADQHFELAATAAGRHAALTALADITATLTAAIAPLYPQPAAGAYPQPAAADIRAAADEIATAAREALQVVAELEPVAYTGSLTNRHGVHTLDGACRCHRCSRPRDRIRLTRPFQQEPPLTCVRPGSVQAAPLDVPLTLPVTELTATIDATLTAPSTGAASRLFTAALLLGRTRLVLDSWSATIGQRLSGRFITALDGRFAPQARDGIIARLDRTAEAMSGAQSWLRDAARRARGSAAGPSATPAS